MTHVCYSYNAIPAGASTAYCLVCGGKTDNVVEYDIHNLDSVDEVVVLDEDVDLEEDEEDEEDEEE